MLRENFSQISTIEWTREFRAPIHIGDVMGILTFYSEGKGSAQYELVATRSVAARENAPPTLEQIVAYTQADENPLPRFSTDLLVPPGLIAAALLLLRRWRRHTRRVRPKLPGKMIDTRNPLNPANPSTKEKASFSEAGFRHGISGPGRPGIERSSARPGPRRPCAPGGTAPPAGGRTP